MTTVRKISTHSFSKVMMILATIFLMSSCNSLKKLTREQKGALIGVGAGAAAGAAIGSKSKNPAVYAIVGSAVGGIGGAVIGRYMDKQAEKLERELGNTAEVERVGEGIKITMDSGILFATDSYNLSAKSKSSLEKLSATLKEYPDTEILVAGHTDNTGTEAYNLRLSEKRADAVSDFLSANGVKRTRLVVKGYGESAPSFDNNTESGRDKNRRVEMAIVANDKLKKTAKSEESVSQNN
ncbi:OmpA family protein [Emticicia sp. CRIBPO]|uniref:OmpA family protein n=1 Tax=Emticicia sp. CRIBPO TaxID=2683258 RepID=UPI001411D45B|nr:OmpA family protein [Emticicia sp. CRIBPO]NBA87233.1 OmpA family protein [Emticicia sp. CRIBPO]